MALWSEPACACHEALRDVAPLGPDPKFWSAMMPWIEVQNHAMIVMIHEGFFILKMLVMNDEY